VHGGREHVRPTECLLGGFTCELDRLVDELTCLGGVSASGEDAPLGHHRPRARIADELREGDGRVVGGQIENLVTQ
jgi:hypothetical protein